MSQGFTNAEKALPANYAPGDVVSFHRQYKRIGIEKGDERRVVGVDSENGKVILEGPNGSLKKTVGWEPEKIGGRSGGAEVYKVEGSSFGPVTASAGPATTGASVFSTAAPRK